MTLPMTGKKLFSGFKVAHIFCDTFDCLLGNAHRRANRHAPYGPLPFHYDMGNLHLGYGCNE